MAKTSKRVSQQRKLSTLPAPIRAAAFAGDRMQYCAATAYAAYASANSPTKGRFPAFARQAGKSIKQKEDSHL